MSLAEARAHIIRLFDRLDQAFNDGLPNTVENERRRLAGAAWSIATFLGKSGFDLPFAQRFFELASAIEDLNLGIRTELLTPLAQGSRRTPDPAEEWRARACVALALEALIGAGRTREAAAKEIARRFLDVQKLINKKQSAGGGPVTKASIEWRKKLPSVKNWHVTDFYALGKECIAGFAGANHAGDHLVEFANDMGGRASQLARLPSNQTKP